MMILAHHEILIAIEYSIFAGGGTLWAARMWWRSRKAK